MTITGLLILGSGFFLLTLVGVPEVSRHIRGLHYGWVIVGLGSVMWVTSTGIRFAASLLIPSLTDPDRAPYFGWSLGLIAFAFTIQFVLAGLLGPLAGWFADRYGVRRVMVGGAILFIASMMLTGSMTQIWQFWLYFGVIMSASIAVFQVTLVAGVTYWFKTQLGLAMGILQALLGIGTAAMVLLVFILFNSFGIRWTFWLPGILGGAILLLGIRYFYDEPAAIGLRPYGASEDDPIRSPHNIETAKIRTAVFLRQAQGTTAFWNLIGIHFWGCAGHNVILVFLIAMAEANGMSQAMAVGVYITLTVLSAVSRFFAPVVADRTGSKGVMGVCFALQTFPVLLLLVAQDPWVFFSFAVLFGIGMGGEMTAFPIINRQYFGGAPTGTTYGYQMLGAGMGMALGPLAAGFLWDLTGEYTGAITLSFALSLVGIISIFALPTTTRHLLPEWEDSLPPEARTAV